MPWYEFEGKRPTVDPAAFVHPDAVLIGAVVIEAECYVGAGAVLRGDIGTIRMGRGSNLQENCVVHTFPDRETVLEPDSHIGHGAVLHGCQIHSRVLVGMGAIVADGAVINSECIVGAGSFVSFGAEIPSGSVVAGSPAKVIRALTAGDRERMDAGLAIYRDLARRCLRSLRECDSLPPAPFK